MAALEMLLGAPVLNLTSQLGCSPHSFHLLGILVGDKTRSKEAALLCAGNLSYYDLTNSAS